MQIVSNFWFDKKIISDGSCRMALIVYARVCNRNQFSLPCAYICANLHYMNDVFNFLKPIAIGADHAGYEYKTMIVEMLQARGLQINDMGTHSKDSVDYPDFAHPVSAAVESGAAACGILICGTANGVAITANKHQKVRAAICWTDSVAMLVRQHNDANIICIPARFVSPPAAEEMVNIFLSTAFEGGRHQERVAKMACI